MTAKKKTIATEVADALHISEEASFSVKALFGHQHMLAAAHFARLSGRVEKEQVGLAIPEDVRTQHQAFVTGSIMFCVASLEATINEFYLEALDGSGRIGQLGENVRSLLTELWKVLKEMKWSPLGKYQVALAAAGRKRFDAGRTPYQNARILVELRNALTHYRPEWHDRQNRHKNLEGKLKPLFAANPLGGRHAFFPDRCLGYGCAEWAVTSAVEFVDAFFGRLGVPSDFDPFRERLHTKV